MRKNFKILTALCAPLLLVLNYFYQHFSFFKQPNTEMSQSANYTQQTLANTPHMSCYKSNRDLSEIHQQQFSFLIWNLHKGQDQGWKEALQQYSHNTDFLLLQEVSNQQHLPTLLQQQFPYFIHTTGFEYKKTQSGVAILSKNTAQSFCTTLTKEPIILVPKTAILANYPLTNGKSLVVVNVHSINFEYTTTQWRLQLQQLINLVATHSGPIVFAGDFNSWNKKRIQLLTQLMQKQGLHEITPNPDDRLRFISYPLDHIFVRGLTTIHAYTLQTQSSDHNPLILTVELE